ncbi:sugar kinase [Niallia sp. MER TA 168]|uniref:sugar kinase n=1 Tax=Niallia sp. MER TA 168 TaxID=2939568 RepID=UPI0020425E8A|nr:sugar kinase [Niallia sp. MER TA 168]MCM3363362.1 sugar kinase [Niallia sp. MER TA 168]
MQSIDVITFGEAMAMFIADSCGPLHEINHYTMELAGAETNVAIGLAKLGYHASFVSKVGADAFGKFIMEKLQKHHVQVDQILTDTLFPTGFQLKSRVTQGDPEVQYFRKGSAASHLSISDFNERCFQKAKHLHMTGIPLALSSDTRNFAKHALSFFKNNAKKVSFDPNLRPKLWKTEKEMVDTINFFAKQANYVLPGLEEGIKLTGFEKPSDIASYYLDAGVELVIIKLGEKGAYYKSAKEEAIINGYPVEKIVDTVGAGDGFAVGVISGILENLPVEESVQRGNAIGALAVQSLGDNTGYPDKQELVHFINNQSQRSVRI